MVENLKIHILFFRVPKKGMSGLPYLLKPWLTFSILYGKLMSIMCQIVRYIQISWAPFVHPETSSALGSLTLKGFDAFFCLFPLHSVRSAVRKDLGQRRAIS